MESAKVRIRSVRRTPEVTRKLVDPLKKPPTPDLVKKPLLPQTDLVKKTKVKTKISKKEIKVTDDERKIGRKPKIKIKGENPEPSKSDGPESIESSEKSSEHRSDNLINVNPVFDEVKKAETEKSQIEISSLEIKSEVYDADNKALEIGIVPTGSAREQNIQKTKSAEKFLEAQETSQPADILKVN